MAPYKITIRPVNLVTSNAVYIAGESGNFLDDFRHFLLKDGSMLLTFPLDGSKTPNDIAAIIGKNMIYTFVDHVARIDYSNSSNSDITAHFVVESHEDFDSIPYRYISRKSVRGKNFMEFNTGEVERFKGYFTKNKGLVKNIYEDGHFPISEIESLVGEHAAYEVITFLGTSEWMVRPIKAAHIAIIENTPVKYTVPSGSMIPPTFLVRDSKIYSLAYTQAYKHYYREIADTVGVIA